MARKKFEPEVVADAAMRLFWQRGYRETSVDDVVAATGVLKGSLYHTFRDKDGLFAAALGRYAATAANGAKDALADADPLNGIGRVFDGLARRMCDPAVPEGCLTTNTIAERLGADPAIDQIVRAQMDALAARFLATLERAENAGQVAPGHDLQALSQFLVALTRGMAVMSKLDPSGATAGDVASVVPVLLAGLAPKTEASATPRRRTTARRQPRDES